MINMATVFDRLYSLRSTRKILFRKATLSGGVVAYPTVLSLTASVHYREVGFDPERGVLYPMNRVELHIWFRDWFVRSTDPTTEGELKSLVRDLKGDVKEGDPEHHSRFIVDGATYKYDHHAYDERPDGVPFAVLVTLQAA